MDAWFVEDEEIFIHPKDPYKVRYDDTICQMVSPHLWFLNGITKRRVDILQSSRHVRVELNGVILAETHSPRLLFETGLRVRTYIPKTDCKMELWVPSNTKTGCPYKVSSYN
jgi:RNase P/RNase MRP subunit p29